MDKKKREEVTRLQMKLTGNVLGVGNKPLSV